MGFQIENDYASGVQIKIVGVGGVIQFVNERKA